MRWYRFDPFAHRTAEQCTVGALRAEVAGHDVSIHSMEKGRHAHAGEGLARGHGGESHGLTVRRSRRAPSLHCPDARADFAEPA